ncbi:GtrA family protein [Caldalkalibacillus salinus]|uniref:GtrA family protein n=1 Tax=Caldalkalibacillus salinus TaxID=2803787 RepID=UPI001920C531|nr:GtrA family protein [Caldalkalibacillus salinus]
MFVKVFTYGMVGVLGTLIHFGVLILFVELFNQGPVLSSTIGFIVTLIVSYYLNQKYTFKIKSTQHTKLFTKYTIVSCSGLILNGLIMYLAVQILSFHYMLGQAIVVFILPLTNFILNNLWTFKEDAV